MEEFSIYENLQPGRCIDWGHRLQVFGDMVYTFSELCQRPRKSLELSFESEKGLVDRSEFDKRKLQKARP